MVLLLPGMLLFTGAALVILLWSFASKASTIPSALRIARIALLSIAAIFSGLLAFVCFAAAAWDMNTHLPWGVGILMYLIPMLSLPAFLILKFSSLRVLSRVLWILTAASSFAFYFGDQAERAASGMPTVTITTERLGLFANAFTLVLFGIAVLVQTASLCSHREHRLMKEP